MVLVDNEMASSAPPEETGRQDRGDPTVDALDGLLRVLGELAEDQARLTKKLEDLRRVRLGGLQWHEILAKEDAPGSMQTLSRILGDLAQASGALRKELVEDMRRQGVSIPAIARLFGVTHQRVSNLLRRRG